MLAGTQGKAARTIVAAIVTIGGVSAPAAAKVFKGNSRANHVKGTKRADKIRLGAGNDRASGRGGNDRISGGKGKDTLSGDAGNDRLSGDAGNDKLTGGKGKDRLSGGAGNDRLNAADGRRDAKIDGGKGRNACRLDPADLKIAKHCATVKLVPASGGNGNAGGGAGGGGGSSGSLTLTQASGLKCSSALPTCMFQIVGTGADSQAGTVTGGGGVSPGAGASVSVNQPDWQAHGAYGCTSDGFLRVTIGSKHVDVPVDCTADRPLANQPVVPLGI